MKKDEGIRQPIVAGVFYPADADELYRTVHTLLNEAGSSPGEFTENVPNLLLLPHAAYQYIGAHLGAAFATQVPSFLGERDITCPGSSSGKTGYSRIFLLATVHRDPSDYLFLPEFEVFRTPLGDIEVDREMITRLSRKNPLFVENDTPFREEHSLEIPLPFLTQVFPGLKIVPILSGNNSLRLSRALEEALEETLKEAPTGLSPFDQAPPLFIVSSNLSDYTTAKTSRAQADRLTALLDDFSPNVFFKEEPGEEIGACGIGPLRAVLRILGPSIHTERLLTGTSGSIQPEQREVWYGTYLCRPTEKGDF